MGMPDLGGVMDILATLSGSESLLYDLYDEPDEVKRVNREIQNIWLRYYQEFSDILMQTGPSRRTIIDCRFFDLQETEKKTNYIYSKRPAQGNPNPCPCSSNNIKFFSISSRPAK